MDIKSVKLALGIPVRASTVSSYREAISRLPLDEFRKVTLAIYFARASSVENFTNDELGNRMFDVLTRDHHVSTSNIL